MGLPVDPVGYWRHCGPAAPIPLLAISGEQGSAKTVQGRAGTRIITMRKAFENTVSTVSSASTVSRVRDEGVRRASAGTD
jgi:hypothetical protein